MSLGLPLHVAALGCLATPGRGSRPQLALPTDLFMVTVHCAVPPAGERDALEMTVTLLRTRPERFRSRSPGELAFALLTPAGLLDVLRAPLAGATDARLPLARFCTQAELRGLRDGLLDAPDAAARMQFFAAWIEDRIRRRHRFGRPQQRVAEAAVWIQRHAGPADLSRMRGDLHVSQRQLERDFRLWLGVSPAVYARLVRFQRAAMDLAAGAAPGEAAAAHAFFDQPHLTRTFRQLSALTPREFARAAAGEHPAQRRALAGRVVVLEAPVVNPRGSLPPA